MSGFKKIELDAVGSTKPQTASISRSSVSTAMSGRKKKATKIPHPKILIALGIIIILLILISFPIYATYKAGLKTYREAKLISGAFKKQDLDLASTEIQKTKVDLIDTQKSLHKLFLLKYVPVANFYYNDTDHLLTAGSSALDSAATVADSLKPYVDVLGLKGKGSFTGGSAENRIQTAVMAIGKVTPKIDVIEQQLKDVRKEIDQINPAHYPKFIFGSRVQTQLTTIRDLTDGSETFVTEAKPLVKLLPSLLGETEKKKYLILFQNDKELRPTGGFITAYAIFSVDKGVIHAEKSEDIYSLDNTISNKPQAPAPILKYFPKVYTFNLRDSNLSPDYIKSMETFRSMYESAGSSENVDGIIALDTSVLVSTIKILDDSVTAGGITFNTKNEPICDCPQVIYQLEDSISRPVGYIKSERKGLLGQLLQAILSKALSSSPKIYWGPLFQSFIAQTNQKHVLFYLYDKDAQSGIEALNAAGRIRNFEGDYLHINEANFSGAKVNIFMQEAVENNYNVQGDGSIQKVVTITYKNPYPPSDCNLERGGLCLNAEYRDWIRILVPKGSQLLDSKGSQVKMSTYDELGKTVFEGFVTVRPKGFATLTLTYKLPFTVKSGSPLPVLIQKQPGTNNNQYTTIVNGHTVETFPLLSDHESKLKL